MTLGIFLLSIIVGSILSDEFTTVAVQPVLEYVEDHRDDPVVRATLRPDASRGNCPI